MERGTTMGVRGAATRTSLLRAAVECVVEDGWQAAGARAVTARAGVPLGALNYHFGSKDELLRTAASTEVQKMFATPWSIIASSETVEDLVDGMVGWSRASDVTPQQQALLLEVMSHARRDSALSSTLGRALASYRGALAQALERLGVIDHVAVADGASPDAQGLAGAFAAQCNGLWLQFVIEPESSVDIAAAAAAAAWKAALTRSAGSRRPRSNS